MKQAQWKERPGVNEDLMHQAITGDHAPPSRQPPPLSDPLNGASELLVEIKD